MTHYTQNCPRHITASPAGLTDSLLHLIRQWMARQRLKASIQRERASLMTLSDDQLKDIGIDRIEAQAEAARNDIPPVRAL